MHAAEAPVRRVFMRYALLACAAAGLRAADAGAQDSAQNMFWRNSAGNSVVGSDVNGTPFTGNFPDARNWSVFAGKTQPASGSCPDPIVNCDPIEPGLPSASYRAVFDIGGAYTVQQVGGATSGLDVISGNVSFILDDLGVPLSLNAGSMLAVKPGDPHDPTFRSASASFIWGALSAGHFMVGMMNNTAATLSLFGVNAVSNGLSVAQAGRGTLILGGTTFEDGPLVGTYLRTTQQGLNAQVGGQSGSVALVNVSSNATWEIVSGPLHIGGASGSSAELHIIGTQLLQRPTTTATVRGASLHLARGGGSQATVLVDGGGASLIMPGGISVGEGGEGTLNVLGGGQVFSAPHSTSGIGTFNGSIGRALVRGADDSDTRSAWTLGGLNVGGGGQGTLIVGAGGMVDARGFVSVHQRGTIDVHAGGTLHAGALEVRGGGHASVLGELRTASVHVDGPGSSVVQTGNGVVIDDGAGRGSLTVTNGGLYSGAPTIALSSDKTGVANIRVSDAGSQWLIGEQYLLGAGGGRASALIEQGGYASSGGLTVGGASEGDLVVSQSSRWDAQGPVHVGGTPLLGAGDAGRIALQSSGAMHVADSLTVWRPGSLELSGGELVVDGALNVDGGRVDVGEGSFLQGSLLAVRAGGSFDSAPRLGIGSGGNFDALELTGAFLRTSTLHLGNAGVASLGAGAALVSNSIEMRGGTLRSANAFEVTEHRSLGGHGTVDAPLEVEGELYAAGGTLAVSGAVNIAAGGALLLEEGTLSASGIVVDGTILGEGTIDAGAIGVALNGLLSPGFGDNEERLGVLTFLGDLAFGAESIARFDIAGTAAGEYDQVVVKGTARFGGELELAFLDGFAPREGDSFALFVDDFLGSFESVLVSGLAPGFQYSLDASPSGLSLVALNDGIPVAIPEPQTYALMLAGLALLGFSARSRRGRRQASKGTA